jgi:hypothetical protein
MNPSRQIALADAEERLAFSNSYNRGDRLHVLFTLRHPRRIELLGEEWSSCDSFPAELLRIVGRLPRPALAAMTAQEREVLNRLPDRIVIWRGCYQSNLRGWSWSLDHRTAARFPFYTRYQQDGTPLLVKGRVARDRVVFLKLDREEREVVVDPDDVRIINSAKIKQARRISPNAEAAA